MTEILVWILFATGGANNGSSIMEPLYFNSDIQCQHVAKEIKNLNGIMNTPKCVQARILVRK